ncbi:MAG: ATP-binding protein [Deltaproteobacteria bacterium]|nr:ATP-binding protein [Deltaproteobacteria bacterium]
MNPETLRSELFSDTTTQVKALFTTAMEGKADARERAGQALLALARGGARELSTAAQAVLSALYAIALTLADRVKALLDQSLESGAFAGTVALDPDGPPRLLVDLGGRTVYALAAEDLDVASLRRGDVVGVLHNGAVYRRAAERPRALKVARVELLLGDGDVVASDVEAGGHRFVLQRADRAQAPTREGDQVFHAFGFYYASRQGKDTCTTPRFRVELTPRASLREVVAGHDALVDSVERVVRQVLEGRRPGAGVLLAGRFGMGKSLLGERLGDYALGLVTRHPGRYRYQGVTALRVSGATLLSKWVGQSAANVTELLHLARRIVAGHGDGAERGGRHLCVLVIDEAEGAAASRASYLETHTERVGLVDSLLVELQFEKPENEGIIAVVVSNHASRIDGALLSRLSLKAEFGAFTVEGFCDVAALLLRMKGVAPAVAAEASRLLASRVYREDDAGVLGEVHFADPTRAPLPVGAASLVHGRMLKQLVDDLDPAPDSAPAVLADRVWSALLGRLGADRAQLRAHNASEYLTLPDDPEARVARVAWRPLPSAGLARGLYPRQPLFNAHREELRHGT